MADMGRPPLFKTPEDMQAAVDAYVEQCKSDGRPLTITGLAIGLGFDSRQSIYDYEEKGNFAYIVKKARFLVENSYEEKLTSGGQVAGPIFALKNMGNKGNWTDKQEIAHTGPNGGPMQFAEVKWTIAETDPGNSGS